MQLFLAIFSSVLLVIALAWGRRKITRLEGALRELDRELLAVRQRQQEKTAEIQAHQEIFFNSMVEGFLHLDPTGKILAINPALMRLFRIIEDPRGRSFQEVFAAHGLERLLEEIAHEPVVRGYEIELAGPENRFLEVNAARIFEKGDKPAGTIMMFHELTRLKQLENTRREFVANVSHELRTPLTLIKGFVETLLDGAKDDPAHLSRFLLTIQKHTDRLTYLIEDLLTISRLESGQVQLELRQNKLRDIVEQVLEDLQSRAAEKQVFLENKVEPHLEALVDFQRMQQVLFNLVENAIKYGPNGGRVAISARPRQEFIEVSVSDNGPGIPAEARERIFERFYRLDSARSPEQGGTGLGLAIVKHIVQAHRGAVWVESNPGEGSTFFFTAPAVRPPPPQQEEH